jgi:tetrahydrodipicolinate N-succinyltransferase
MCATSQQVGSGVLIGAGAVLLGGITVGDGAQIGACSMVLADIPAGCVAVGVPAKVLGKSKVKNPAASMQQVRTAHTLLYTYTMAVVAMVLSSMAVESGYVLAEQYTVHCAAMLHTMSCNHKAR